MSRKLISLLAKMVSGLTELAEITGIKSEKRDTLKVIMQFPSICEYYILLWHKCSATIGKSWSVYCSNKPQDGANIVG